MSAAYPSAAPHLIASAVPAAPRRFYELDSLRGLAAATVVLHHFNYLLPRRAHDLLSRGPLRILVSGHQAVMLFFVLSGFVLTLPYLRRTSLEYRSFLIKRLCRIYLPYLAALGLAIAAELACPPLTHALTQSPSANTWIAQTWSVPISWRPILQHVFFIGVYDNAQFNTAFWSLVYEMRISLVFPFLAHAVLRWRTSLIAAAAFALWPVSLLINRFFPRILHMDLARVSDLGDTLFYAAMFIVGALLAKHLVRADSWFASLTRLTTAVFAVACLVIYAPGLAIRHLPPGFFDVVTAGASLGFILLAINCGPVQRFLTAPPVHHLGKISYSLYLVHGSVLFFLIHTLVGRVSISLIFALYLVCTLTLTELFYHLVEKPTMLLGRHLTANRDQK